MEVIYEALDKHPKVMEAYLKLNNERFTLHSIEYNERCIVYKGDKEGILKMYVPVENAEIIEFQDFLIIYTTVINDEKVSLHIKKNKLVVAIVEPVL